MPAKMAAAVITILLLYFCLSKGDFFDSNFTDTAANDPMCPEVQEADYIEDFLEEVTGLELDDDLDDIVIDIQSVIDVFQEDVICP